MPLRASGLGQTGTPAEPDLLVAPAHAEARPVRRWLFIATVKENCYV